MFIRINESRIKAASIGEFENQGKSVHTEKWYLNIKISGKWKSFTFNDKERMDEVVTYLDKVLKVEVV